MAWAFDALRGVRHAGAAALHHAALARPRPGRAAGAGARSRRAVRQGHPQVRHGAAVRARAQSPGTGAPRAACARAPSSRRSTSSRRAPPTSASSRRASPTPYAREAFPKAWFLKLGMSHPLPVQKVAKLYDAVSRVAVVEELDPFIEDQVRALGCRWSARRPSRPTASWTRRSSSPPSSRTQAPAAAPPRARVPAARAGHRTPAPAPSRRSARAPAGALPGLPAPRRLRHAAPREGRPSWATSAATRSAPCRRWLSLESCLCMGASIGMMAGINRSTGARRRRRRARRLDVLSLRRHAADRRPLQRDARAWSSCSTTAPPP